MAMTRSKEPRFQTAVIACAFRAALFVCMMVAFGAPSAIRGEQTESGGSPVPSSNLIGYSEYRTNLPGGRHANASTMRACVIRPDGTGRRELAKTLREPKDAWTQFAGWSPDGRYAVIGSGWENPENAAWEEEHQQFRMIEGQWRYDSYLLDMRDESLRNVTAVEGVSHYNAGVFFLPGRPGELGFTALIDGQGHPFVMDLDGRNKRDLTKGSGEFTYGFNASPDGDLVAYHKSYQVHIAKADGSEPIHVETGNPFNFSPVWSPDGKRIVFVSGEHYDCDVFVVERDGANPREVANRNDYRGVVPILDVPDFHGGSSDTPIWGADSDTVYYTARVGESVELMKKTLGGEIVQLTHSPPGALNYHPQLSPNKKWLAFGSNRTGTRQIYIMPTAGGESRRVTDVDEGWGAMWAHWRPPGGE